MERQGLSPPRAESATVPLGAARSVLDSFPVYFAHDMTVDRASDYLWKNHPVQVFSTYFRLPDIMSHFAGHFIDAGVHQQTLALEQAGRLDAAALQRIDAAMAKAVAPAYRFMDRIIAKYLARVDERTLLLVCSDHGFAYFRGGYNHYNPAMDPPDGVLFLRGPGVRKGYEIRSARLFDLAPTILQAMGQPVADDMDGAFLAEAFEDSWVRAHPPVHIASYETTPRARAAPGSHRVDEEVLEDLRTLGYIEVPTPDGSSGPERP
jgi:arylsulfatase A-like enzyme